VNEVGPANGVEALGGVEWLDSIRDAQPSWKRN
jgi:hypothetical protein